MDSFDKYARDFYAGGEGAFGRVHPEDLEQVKVAFAIQVSHLAGADNFRIYPLRDRDAFYAQAARGCCGEWNSQVNAPASKSPLATY